MGVLGSGKRQATSGKLLSGNSNLAYSLQLTACSLQLTACRLPLAACRFQLLLLLLFLSPPLAKAEPPADWHSLFPHATAIGEKQQNPPVWPVYQVGNLIGYLFESIDLIAIPAFSGEPVNLLVGIDLEGTLTGVKLLEHHEPIFLHGLGEAPLRDFLRQYSGLSAIDNIKVDNRRSDAQGANVTIDGITKATASVVVINESILLSALKVARQTLEGFESKTIARVRENLFEAQNLQALLDAGYIGQLSLDYRQVQEAFAGTTADGYDAEGISDPAQRFIDLYYAYLNVPTVGKNLLGELDYQRLQKSLKPGEQAIAVFSRGPYSFVGDDFVPASIPDRLALHQQKLPIEIRDINFYDYDAVYSPYLPLFDSYKIFRIKPQADFDPGSPWQLSLVVSRSRGTLFQAATTSFEGNYHLPARFFSYPEVVEDTEPTPLWVTLWHSRWVEILALLSSLVLLTAIFIYQHALVRHRTAFRYLRWGFLTFTLVVIGWYSQGQLSVVNVFTILQSLIHGFKLEVYLIDPIIFILWVYVFVTLFLWGRGLFCGWLCPFGAMQEMLSWLAKKLSIPQVKLSYGLHTRLATLKYAILLGLVGLSFYSLSAAEIAAEVEPFKTAITLFFVRSWPFLLYACLLLGAGLTIHKFYCRYLCPLGAGLAILNFFRSFSWLHRRRECGNPCQLCRHKCEIDAITPDGDVDYNECIQCLECIVYYNGEDLCPPQINAVKRQRKKVSQPDFICVSAEG